MSALIWDKKTYTVCIKEIDQQHEKLIAMINELHAAMKQGRSKMVLKGILEELSSYTKYHFCTEENYFCKFSYKDKEAHVAEHNLFVEQIDQFQKDFEAGKQTITIELFRFLTNWLDNHIKISDRKYTPCFLNNGLE